MFTEIFEKLGWKAPFTYKVVLLFKSPSADFCAAGVLKKKKNNKNREKRKIGSLNHGNQIIPNQLILKGRGSALLHFLTISKQTALWMNKEAERDWSIVLSESKKQNLK